MNEHRFSLEKKKGKEESENFFFAFVSGWASRGVRVYCIQVGTTVFAHLGLSRGMSGRRGDCISGFKDLTIEGFHV